MTEREDSLSQLRPCPFCGGEAYYTESVNGSQMAYVGCTVCGISAKAARTGHNLTEWTKDLKLMWNTRARASMASIVKAAFEAARKVAHKYRELDSEHPCQGCAQCGTAEGIELGIAALTPESAILGAQIAELEARLEEADKWERWHYGDGDDDLYWNQHRKADLESQLSALKAKREGGAKK